MKDAKGHGSDPRGGALAVAAQHGIPTDHLQPHGMPVPANSMDKIEGHLKAGGELFVPSAWKPTRIPSKSYDSWKAAGTPLIRPEGQGYRMRQGRKSSVYLLPGQLRFIQ